jgi:Ca-activated chloride channel family protein
VKQTALVDWAGYARRFAIVAALIAYLPAFVCIHASAQEPSFRSSSTELVVLPVVVTDKHGQFIADLDKGRFTVFDNGRRVNIDFFSGEDAPVAVGLVVDASSSMGPKLGEVVAAALRFASSSNPDDELFAIRFNDDVKDALPDRRFLLASDRVALQRALTSMRAQGRTALYDALLAGLDHLEESSRARKILIAISDGGDNASQGTLDRVLARARRSNVTIYTIGLFDDVDPDKNPRVLKELARTTGGERFLPRSAGPLVQVCERIAREIRSGYTIGYAPPDRDGFYHRVRVVVDAGDRHVEVRTRPGYFAGRDTSQ